MEKANKVYSVKQLAKLAGVSVRTLHVYDRMGLLKPALRTISSYRMYGEQELLRLQQILFYKELDFPLKQIKEIMDDPDFDLIKALDGHKDALLAKKKRLNTLLNTINETVDHLKNKTMQNFEKLYEGMPREQAQAYHNEAIDKWGEEAVLTSEKSLLKLSKTDLESMKSEQKEINLQLIDLVNQDPTGPKVQFQIARHYVNIRSFWGISDLKAAQYKGLGELYMTNERYLTTNGKPNPQFAGFMRTAMAYFADTKLK